MFMLTLMPLILSQPTMMIRDALKKKLRDYLGIFPKWRPPPIPPFWEPLIRKKLLSFILHFRPLGTFLVFNKKLLFLHLLLGIGTPPHFPNTQNSGFFYKMNEIK